MFGKTRFLIKVAVLSLSIFLLACGDPATQAKGTVRDAAGNPVEGVTVVMESNAQPNSPKEAEQKTKTDGSYSFLEITAPATKTKLIFKKDGFKTSEKEITPDKENNNDVVLERESK